MSGGVPLRGGKALIRFVVQYYLQTLAHWIMAHTSVVRPAGEKKLYGSGGIKIKIFFLFNY